MKSETHKHYEELIAVYLADSIDESGFDELTNWLNESETNRKLFDQYREVWLSTNLAASGEMFDQGKAFLKFKNQVLIKQIHQNNKNMNQPLLKRKMSMSLLKVAAIILFAFIGGIMVHILSGKKGMNAKQAFYQEIIVPLGAKSQVKLPDGTRVILNAGSKMQYRQDFGNSKREVRLEGEGYFKVVKDSRHPFVVKTKYINVKAVGTVFNIKAYDSDKTVETTLVEGLVQIEKNKQYKDGNEVNDQIVLLKPNQKFTLVKSEADLESVNEKLTQQNSTPGQLKTIMLDKRHFITENFDLSEDISWKDKRWTINSERLDELAVELERRYDVSIRFDNDRLKSYRFTGIIKDESLEQVLNAMSLSAPIEYTLKGKDIIFAENNDFMQKYKKLFNTTIKK